jgi:transposase-like protein
MAKRDEREEAIRLRVEGRYSYSEILEQVRVSKSTLSLWLRDYPLTKEEIAQKKSHKPHGGRARKTLGEPSKFHCMAGGKLSKDDKARVAEAATLFRLVLHGIQSYNPVFDGQKFDWLVHVPQTDKTLRVQVKWAADRVGKTGGPYIQLVCSNGRGKARRYREREVDFFVAYVLFNDTCYVWSFDEVRGQATVSVSEESAERWDKITGA